MSELHQLPVVYHIGRQYILDSFYISAITRVFLSFAKSWFLSLSIIIYEHIDYIAALLGGFISTRESRVIKYR
jgi:hypothetical protein